LLPGRQESRVTETYIAVALFEEKTFVDVESFHSYMTSFIDNILFNPSQQLYIS
jgi:hypothetical protein